LSRPFSIAQFHGFTIHLLEVCLVRQILLAHLKADVTHDAGVSGCTLSAVPADHIPREYLIRPDVLDEQNEVS
jgi:hypothetical protein